MSKINETDLNLIKQSTKHSGKLLNFNYKKKKKLYKLAIFVKIETLLTKL